MEIQNNLNKSIELSNKLKCITIGERCKNIEDACLEMAQWKQQQMIEKSVEWLNAHLPFGEVDFNLRNTIIEDFKQSMEEK